MVGPEVLLGAGAKGFAGAFGKLALEHAARALGRTSAKPEEIRTNLKPHIEATFQRCSSLKTLLNPHQPAEFLSIYATQRFSIGDRLLDHYGLVDIIKTDMNHVIITGTGGSGKSMFMKYLWLSLFVESEGRVPLFVELRNMNTLSQDDLVTYLHHTLTSGKASISARSFRRQLEAGDFIILLDGFDELEEDRKIVVQSVLIDMTVDYPDTKIVMSSRPPREGRLASWHTFNVVEVSPLLQKDMVELIEKSEFDTSNKRRFLKKIKDEKLWDSHRSFLESPLLASMMLLTFSHNFDIPSTMHVFYDQAFNALFERHDSHKPGGYKREFKTNMSEFEFKRLLSYFCLISYFDNTIEFTKSSIISYIEKAIRVEKLDITPEQFLYDLEECVCMIVLDGNIYSFPHRTFQEYFAAYCLAFVTNIRYQDFVSEFGKRHTDQSVKLLNDMNSNGFRDNYIIPVSERLSSVLQTSRRTKSVVDFMKNTQTSFVYHIGTRRSATSIEKSGGVIGNDDYVSGVDSRHDAFYFAMLMDKVFPRLKGSSNSRIRQADTDMLNTLVGMSGGRVPIMVRVCFEADSIVFRVYQNDLKKSKVIRDVDLTETFKQSEFPAWLTGKLKTVQAVVQSQTAARNGSSDAINALFD